MYRRSSSQLSEQNNNNNNNANEGIPHNFHPKQNYDE